MFKQNNDRQRTQSLLLLTRLLQLKDNISPFVLLLDSLEQSSNPLVSRIIANAQSSKINTTVLSYTTPTVTVSGLATTIIRANGLSKAQLHSAIPSPSTSAQNLIIVDSLNALASHLFPNDLTSFLSSLVGPRCILLGTYHLDVPFFLSPQASYTPTPLTLLRYLATSIITLYSHSHELARKRARDRAQPEPVFGLAEDEEGVLVGVGANDDAKGLVIDLEHRRRSGRVVIAERFFVPPLGRGEGECEVLKFAADFAKGDAAIDTEAKETHEDGVSFELGLTERQRKDRAGVVLPYFDAQKEGGSAAEGGRILYDIGVEDDFDDEEDEI